MIFINVLKTLFVWGKMNMLTFIEPKGNEGSLETLFVILYLLYKRRLCK